MSLDKEEWVQNRAEEIAEEKYGEDFYDMDKDRQIEVFQVAEDEFMDEWAGRIDALYDAEVERRMMEEQS